MKLLLTGASGFLGRNVLRHVPEDWDVTALYSHDTGFPGFVAGLGRSNITAASCDLGDAASVSSLLSRVGDSWDCCLYLAAKVDIPWSVQHPDRDLLSNTLPLVTLLQSARVRKLIYFSSGAVYDGAKGEVSPKQEVAPTLPYAISKLASEAYVRFFAERRRSVDEYLIVRFFGAYGPYEAAHKIYTRLLRTFALEGSRRYTIYGDGMNLIDAMYVDDAVAAIRSMIDGRVCNCTVNLAGGNPVTIEALVRQVASALGVTSVEVEKQGVAHESNSFWGSTSEMDTLFGFRPSITLEEGMTRFRDWYLANALAGSRNP